MELRYTKQKDIHGNLLPVGVSYIPASFRISFKFGKITCRDRYPTYEETERRVWELREQYWDAEKLRRFKIVQTLPVSSYVMWATLYVGVTFRHENLKKSKKFTRKFSNESDIPRIVKELEVVREQWCREHGYDVNDYLDNLPNKVSGVEPTAEYYHVKLGTKTKSVSVKTFNEAIQEVERQRKITYSEVPRGTATTKIPANKISSDLPLGLSRSTRRRKTKYGTSVTHQIYACVYNNKKVVFRTRLSYGEHRSEEEAIELAAKAREKFLDENPEYVDNVHGRNTGRKGR